MTLKRVLDVLVVRPRLLTRHSPTPIVTQSIQALSTESRAQLESYQSSATGNHTRGQ